MEEIVLIADPRVLSIPVIDRQEEMIDLKDQEGILFGPSPEIPNNTDYTKIRKTVYEKLLDAQALLPKDLRFCLYEGYRSLSLQKMLFDNRFRMNRQLYPQWTEEQVFDETTKMVSPITNKDGSKKIPPHSTGGAVDIYLVNKEGKYVDMGIHPEDWMKDENGTLSQTNAICISEEAKKYRRILKDVLKKVDFVNYPTEYWHWSYGDQYWAYHKGHPHALYGTYAEEQ